MSTPYYTVASNTLNAVNDPCGNFIPGVTGFIANLNEMNDNLNKYNNYIQDANVQQSQVDGIIQKETSRITQQQTSLINATQGKKRIINLNDSYRKKYTQYLKLLIAIVATLLIVWLIKILDKRFGDMLPSFLYYLFDILTILVISFGVIYCYLVYSDIGRHDPLNYDQLYIAPPPNAKPVTSGNALPNDGTSINGGDLLGNNAGCSGKTCCGSDTKWDSTSLKCIKQGFTTMGQMGPNAFSPSEVTEYTSIN